MTHRFKFKAIQLGSYYDLFFNILQRKFAIVFEFLCLALSSQQLKG